MDNQTEQQLKQVRALAALMDSKFQGPLGFKFGIDGIVGLIPFVGDFLTTGVSLYVLKQASDLGCPPTVLFRMAVNVLVDDVLDAIPFLGNIIDFFWKSNTRNLALLERHLVNPQATRRKSNFFFALIVLLLLGALVASGFVTYYVLHLLVDWLKGTAVWNGPVSI